VTTWYSPGGKVRSIPFRKKGWTNFSVFRFVRMVIAWLQPRPPTALQPPRRPPGQRSAIERRSASSKEQRRRSRLGKGRSASHGILEATVVIKRLENSMNPEIEWNSSKL
jgi:hypothetical protein